MSVALVATVNILGGLVYGYTGIGVNAGLQKIWACWYNKDEDDTLLSLAIASVNIGAMLGSMLGGKLLDIIGRKKGIFVASLVSYLAIGSMFASSYGLQLVVRIITGFGIGFLCSACPTYVSEMAPGNLRGTLGSLFQVFCTFGIFLGSIVVYFVLGSHREDDHYCQYLSGSDPRKMSIILLAPGVVMSILLDLVALIIPESNVYLNKKNGAESESEGDDIGKPMLPSSPDRAALISSAMPKENKDIRGRASSHPTQTTQTVISVNGERPSFRAPTHDTYFKTNLRNESLGMMSFIQPRHKSPSEESEVVPVEIKSAIKPLVLGVVMCSALQLTGINAVMFYAPTFLKAANVKNVMMFSILVMAWNFISTLIAVGLVDRLGRRQLLIPSLLLLSASILILAPVNLIHDTSIKTPLTFIFIAAYITGFEVGPGSLFWVICNEIFPESLSVFGFVLSLTLSWVFTLLVTFIFPTLQKAMQSNVFYVFGIPGLVFTAYLFLCLPETKGKTKAQITNSFAISPWLNFGRVYE